MIILGRWYYMNPVPYVSDIRSPDLQLEPHCRVR